MNIHKAFITDRLLSTFASLLFHSHFFLACISVASAQEEATVQAAAKVPSTEAIESLQPNVIVLLTDDQGWGDLSCHGNADLSTQNLDHLSRLGARFDRFYVCPVCSPTRAEFLTGRYYPRTGVSGVSTGKERLNLDERLISQDFKAAGYVTACFGKWHNGSQYPYHPIARGFDEFYGFCSGHWADYFSPPLDHNGLPVQGRGYLVDDFTDRALEFIEANAERKFFLYLPIPTPHSPMQVPDQYWERFKDRQLTMGGRQENARSENARSENARSENARSENARSENAEVVEEMELNFTRAALAMVENIDDNVGRILSKLDALKISESTIIVFFCDNGPNNHRWNAGMKGRKGSVDEGGVRSPLFICWPGKIASNRLVTQICSVADLYPTLAELAGIPCLNTKPFDGISLTPLLTGQLSSLPAREIVSHWSGQTSIRSQQYRLDSQGRLYDMVADPGQDRDLSISYPRLKQELLMRKNEWREGVLASISSADQRPFSVGHPDFHFTQLPARDAVTSGSIRRSAPAPNSSYFTAWTHSEDSIVWNVEVVQGGRFEVEIHYACSDSMVGSELKVSFLEATIQGELQFSHTPAARGAENDRIPRASESYHKEFRPLSLGVVYLPQGHGRLELSAVFNNQLTNEDGVTSDSDLESASESSLGIEIGMLTLRRVR